VLPSGVEVKVVVGALIAALVSQLALPLDAWRSDGAVEIQDAYKWIYQATQGGEHAAPSRDQAAAWLRTEWDSLEPGPASEPLIEPLANSGIVRVNLRPFRAAGGAPDALVGAFVRSAASFKADRRAFEDAWLQLGERLRQGAVGRLTRADWERLDGATRPAGFPAVHHSEGFTASRHPAYRVMTAAEARGLGASLASDSARGRPER
jgi:hypothetical protein